jgi:predicted nucleic acid-binding protein
MFKNLIIFGIIGIIIVCVASTLKNKVEKNIDSRIAVYETILNQ